MIYAVVISEQVHVTSKHFKTVSLNELQWNFLCTCYCKYGLKCPYRKKLPSDQTDCLIWTFTDIAFHMR